MKADNNLIANGIACISLTPEIKKTLAGMSSGQVLEVWSDDPSAREGIPAWCRLTGNMLLETKEHDTEETSFYIKKA